MESGNEEVAGVKGEEIVNKDKLDDLEAWYENYLVRGDRHENAMEVVQNDDLDMDEVEQEINHMMRALEPVSNDGFCTKCLDILYRWSEILQDSQKISIEETYMESARELQASSRNSCRLCALWVEATNSESWEIIYKIENRLSKLKKEKRVAITIEKYREWTTDSHVRFISIHHYRCSHPYFRTPLNVLPISFQGTTPSRTNF